MHHFLIKTTLVFLLIFALIHVQMAPSFAAANSKKVRVAFLGLKFADLALDIQARLLERVTEVLASKTGLEIINPAELQKTIAPEKIAQWLDQQDSSAFRMVAEQLQAAYVVAGNLTNQSRDSSRVLLAGELHRFDRATNVLHKFEILKYYENLGVELVKFKQEYVETMAAPESPKKASWAWLVLVGITATGIIALAVSFASAGGQGGESTGGERP